MRYRNSGKDHPNRQAGNALCSYRCLVSTLAACAFLGAALGTPACAQDDGLVNIAVNTSRTGYPSPLASDQGWGGGSDQWSIVDGRRHYDSWANGLAFTGGHTGGWDSGGWIQPAGPRQATIDFGAPVTFQKVVIWHHGDETNHVPADTTISYWDGSNWVPIAAARVYGNYHEDGTNSGYSNSDEYVFDPVTASKVRYSFDNSGATLSGDPIVHGWIYEFEVYSDVRHGIDLSSVPSNWGPIVSAYHPRFVIADAWGGRHRFPAESILSGAGAAIPGVSKAAYCLLNFDDSGQDDPNDPAPNGIQTGDWQVGQALKALGAEAGNVSFIAIDIEPLSNEPLPQDPDSIAARVARIYEALNAVPGQAVIYTRRSDWQLITGNYPLTEAPLWEVRYWSRTDDRLGSDGPGAWQPYGGWTSRLGRQYVLDDTTTGMNVDLDVFDGSLLP